MLLYCNAHIIPIHETKNELRKKICTYVYNKKKKQSAITAHSSKLTFVRKVFSVHAHSYDETQFIFNEHTGKSSYDIIKQQQHVRLSTHTFRTNWFTLAKMEACKPVIQEFRNIFF